MSRTPLVEELRARVITPMHHLSSQTTYDNYHNFKHLLPIKEIRFAVACVYCGSKGPELSRNSFSGPDDQIISSDGDTMCIQPCGHLAGWACMSRDRDGCCPMCGMLWRRAEERVCPHPLFINKLRLAGSISQVDAEWLVPLGGHVPDRCRACATHEVLRSLTRKVRQEINSQPGCNGNFTYATDGLLSGLLEGDDIKQFSWLDVVVRPPTISTRLMDEAWAQEEQLRGLYEGRTPLAETNKVGKGRIVFKVGGVTKPVEGKVGLLLNCS